MFIRDTRMEWHIFGAYFGDEKIQVGRDLNSNLKKTNTHLQKNNNNNKRSKGDGRACMTRMNPP